MAKQRIISIRPPVGGINRATAFQTTPPFTMNDGLNVRPTDVIDKRGRIGSRPGTTTPWDLFRVTKEVAGITVDCPIQGGASLSATRDAIYASSSSEVESEKFKGSATASYNSKIWLPPEVDFPDANTVQYALIGGNSPRPELLIGEYEFIGGLAPFTTTKGLSQGRNMVYMLAGAHWRGLFRETSTLPIDPDKKYKLSMTFIPSIAQTGPTAPANVNLVIYGTTGVDGTGVNTMLKVVLRLEHLTGKPNKNKNFKFSFGLLTDRVGHAGYPKFKYDQNSDPNPDGTFTQIVNDISSTTFNSSTTTFSVDIDPEAATHNVICSYNCLSISKQAKFTVVNADYLPRTITKIGMEVMLPNDMAVNTFKTTEFKLIYTLPSDSESGSSGHEDFIALAANGKAWLSTKGETPLVLTGSDTVIMSARDDAFIDVVPLIDRFYFGDYDPIEGLVLSATNGVIAVNGYELTSDLIVAADININSHVVTLLNSSNPANSGVRYISAVEDGKITFFPRVVGDDNCSFTIKRGVKVLNPWYVDPDTNEQGSFTLLGKEEFTPVPLNLTPPGTAYPVAEVVAGKLDRIDIVLPYADAKKVIKPLKHGIILVGSTDPLNDLAYTIDSVAPIAGVPTKTRIYITPSATSACTSSAVICKAPLVPPVPGFRGALSYRERLVLYDTTTIVMSRAGDPLDWDFSAPASDPGRAVFLGVSVGTTGQAVELKGVYADTNDQLWIQSATGTWIATSDIAYGGSIALRAANVGTVWKRSMCAYANGLLTRSPAGLFLVSQDGIQPISKLKAPNDFVPVLSPYDRIVCAYDPLHYGAMVFSHQNDKASSWWLDDVTNGIFADKYTFSVTCAFQDPSNPAKMFYGTIDGRVVCHDDTMNKDIDDSIGDDSSPFDSYVLIGPMRPSGNELEQGIIINMIATLDRESEDVTWQVVYGKTAEEVGLKFYPPIVIDVITGQTRTDLAGPTGYWSAGLNYTNWPRQLAGAYGIKISRRIVAGSEYKPWALEGIIVTTQPFGIQRKL